MTKPKTRAVAPASNIDSETGEVTTLPAVLDPGFAVAGVAVKVVKQVTTAVLTWPDGRTIIFSPLDAIRKGKELKNVVAGQAKMAPADLMTIRGPHSEEPRTMIISAVMKSELEENYPKAGYIGKWFQATKIAPKNGKRYATFSLAEIEDPT